MAAPPRAQNVIWIFGDQHRAQALGVSGDPNCSTPNLDRMAGVGLTFSRAVSGYPLCCPYRGSLLTGRYPHHCVPGHEYRMPPEQPTIARAFGEHGYHTAYFGKWHLDGFKERDGRAAMHIVPPERRGGFDQWVGYENNNSQWDCWVHGGAGADAFHRRLAGFETDCLTDMLIEHVRTRAAASAAGTGGPFFAVLSVQPPHDPYVAPEQWMGRHAAGRIELRANVPPVASIQERARRELAGYYAQIENLDWNVGRVRAALIEAGIADETHVMFFSDHGDMHGSHGQFRKTAPWEEAIRVPFVVGGGRDAYEFKGGRVDVPLNHVDVAPTTLGLCGIDAPAWMEGTDYSPYRVRGRAMKNEPDSAYLQSVIPTGHHDSVDRPWRGVVTRDGWKLIALAGVPLMLFDLNEDPYELANHALDAKYGAVRRRLNDRLRAWAADTGDEFEMPDG